MISSPSPGHSFVDSIIALFLVPFALSRQKVIIIFWLKAPALDQLATIQAVSLVCAVVSRKDRLNIMFSLIACALNPDSLSLVHCWDSHCFSPSVTPIPARLQPSAIRPIVLPLLMDLSFLDRLEKSAQKNVSFG